MITSSSSISSLLIIVDFIRELFRGDFGDGSWRFYAQIFSEDFFAALNTYLHWTKEILNKQNIFSTKPLHALFLPYRISFRRRWYHTWIKDRLLHGKCICIRNNYRCEFLAPNLLKFNTRRVLPLTKLETQ